MTQMIRHAADFFSVAALAFLLVACAGNDYPNRNVDGMWKLRTMESQETGVQPVDTIFYNFHRGSLFSCTQFDGEMTQMLRMWNGYFGFSKDNAIHISLAESYRYEAAPWGGEEQKAVFHIVQHTSSKLILEREGVTYHFIKF
ncbi:hypothetical protein AGMMS49965_09080 [Bacteroidia bacterium]|nr:hypothetical protein AGMMS49965_09080 [Bacteroidia bacterium]